MLLDGQCPFTSSCTRKYWDHLKSCATIQLVFTYINPIHTPRAQLLFCHTHFLISKSYILQMERGFLLLKKKKQIPTQIDQSQTVTKPPKARSEFRKRQAIGWKESRDQ